MSKKQKQKDGVSLRKVNVWLIVGAVILSALMFFSTYYLSASFRHLTEISERQIELRKAALELMNASDYLTERVQRFAVQGDLQFLEEYFKEAFDAQHREDAIARMSAGDNNANALKKLQDAMDASMELMNREYYAMRLVISAKGYTGYPKVLRSVTLSDADQALSPEGKMRRAAEMVFSSEYYEQKNQIRSDMQASLNELEKAAYDEDAAALDTLRKEMILVRIMIAFQTAGVIFLVWLTSHLGIHPILRAVDRIKANSRIQEVGANEFRYLARTYNKMFEMFRTSLEHLNFKASHDELTGVYNRSGYELLLSGIDLKSTYMILFDVDNFKSINDTYGHEIGDRVLIRLAQVLKKHFRAEDCICRIGGDEFVVLMVHASEVERDLIAAKIDRINADLDAADDGLPATSISVGIVHGTDASDIESLFKKSDAAMYRSKKSGKHTYTFYQ